MPYRIDAWIDYVMVCLTFFIQSRMISHRLNSLSGLPLTEVWSFALSSTKQVLMICSGLRLADKRSFPCPQRMEWLAARDYLYEEIMEKSWNPAGQFFGQSYENPEVVDSAVLIMPLVFFTSEVGVALPCCITRS